MHAAARILGMTLVAVIVAAHSAAEAAGGLPRTFVASYGNDASPCTRAQPCRSFASAFAQTGDGGEVVALDSAGYGSVTVTRSATITAPTGVYAGVSVTSGNGVTVDGVGITVVLRGLVINGQGSGNIGVDFVHGYTLRVERCTITGMVGPAIFALAPAAAPTELIVLDSTLAGNHGLGAIESSGAVVTTISGVRIVRNALSGILFVNGASFFVRDTAIAHNGAAGIVVEGTADGDVPMTVDRSRIFGNGKTGIEIRMYAFKTADLVISDSEIAGNNDVVPSGAAGGLLIGSDTGKASATLVRTTVADNAGDGVLAYGATSSAILDACVVTGNLGVGLATGLSGAKIYTRGTNVVHHNALELDGAIVLLGGQ